MKSIKNLLKKIYKNLLTNIFTRIYGELEVANKKEIEKYLSIKKITIENNNYNIFKLKSSRLYTTSIHDTAVISNNKLIPGPSYQLRTKKDDPYFARNNEKVEENIVLKNGTPRILKRFKGKVFSFLSGGAAKTNYFHWMYEVLPKLEILIRSENVEDIDFFLLPNNKLKFQIETLDLLKIPKKKILNSNRYKHIFCDEMILSDHPFRLNNDSHKDAQNIPSWIIRWLKNKFINYKSVRDFPEKIFIERKNDLNGRVIENNLELYDLLKKKDFHFIKLEDYDFKDQINIFSTAKIIAGLHGAGFANICFSNQNTQIYEFKTSTTGMLYGNIAIKNSLQYNPIVCETVDKTGAQQGRLIVDLDQLKTV